MFLRLDYSIALRFSNQMSQYLSINEKMVASK